MSTSEWKQISVRFRLDGMGFPKDTIENRKAILNDVVAALRGHFGKLVEIDAWFDLDKTGKPTKKMFFLIERGLE